MIMVDRISKEYGRKQAINEVSFTVGALLDNSMPVPERRAVDHLMWIAHSNGIPRKRVMEVLSEVGLEENARTRVKKYSLGMKQRLGIAVVLLGKPEVIVLDEPMNGLDPEGIHWIRSFMRERAEAGATVLVSSHFLTSSPRLKAGDSGTTYRWFGAF